MKKFTCIALLLFASLSSAQNKTFLDVSYMEMSATADSLVAPDRIYLSIFINELDEKNKISVEELEAKMMIELKALKIDTKEQLTLSDLGSNFKNYFLKKKDIIKAKSYSLKLFDSQTAGKVIVALEEEGISNVNLEKTEYSKIEALELALRTKAMQRAKVQAEALLKPLNQKIKGAIHITENNSNGYLNGLAGSAAGVSIRGVSSLSAKGYIAPEIEFKPINVTAQVYVKFAIE